MGSKKAMRKVKFGDKIEELLIKGEEVKALELLVNYWRKKNENKKRDEAILLLSRANDIKSKLRLNSIDEKSASISLDKIKVSILEHVSSIRDNTSLLTDSQNFIHSDSLEEFNVNGYISKSEIIENRRILFSALTFPRIKPKIFSLALIALLIFGSTGILVYPRSQGILLDLDIYFDSSNENYEEREGKIKPSGFIRKPINSAKGNTEPNAFPILSPDLSVSGSNLTDTEFFPSFDFSFTNKGEDPLFITGYGVELIEVNKNKDEILDFSFQKIEKSHTNLKNEIKKEPIIRLIVNNRGWGEVTNCHCSFKEDNSGIIKAFDTSQETFAIRKIGKNSTEVFKDFSLSKSGLKKFVKKQARLYESKRKARKAGVQVSPRIICNYKNEIGVHKVDTFNVSNNIIFQEKKIIERNRSAFMNLDNSKISGHLMQNSMDEIESQIMYLTIFDLESNDRQSKKGIRYKIEPKDIVGFKILVGFKQPCNAKIRFYFDTSAGPIKSEIFELEVWTPTNIDWKYFQDGKKIKLGSTKI